MEELNQQAPKRRRRKKAAKSVDGLVPGNMNAEYMITPLQQKECYIYAIRYSEYDQTLRSEKKGGWQLVSYRESDVDRAAIWKNGEMEVNVYEQQLFVNYGLDNVVLVNDPSQND